MLKRYSFFTVAVLCAASALTVAESAVETTEKVAGKYAGPAGTVISDSGVGMSREELEQAVKYWSPEMKKAAANSVGDRFELISMTLATKKLAEEANKLSQEEDPVAYWQKEFLMRNALRDFMVNRFTEGLVVPDMTAVAKEYYDVHRDKVSKDAEERLSSHILFRCMDATCDRADVEKQAQKVLKELQNGADFEEMAKQYSTDPGSAARGGLFDKWLKISTPRVAPMYLNALFELEKPGDISDVVKSRYGWHIIRFNEVKPERIVPWEEAKAGLVAKFEHKYKKEMAIEFDRKYRFSDDGFIDGEVMEEIFAPYKTEDPKPPVEKARPVEPAVVTE